MPHPDHKEREGDDEVSEDLACTEGLEVGFEDPPEAVIPKGCGSEGAKRDKDQGEDCAWHLGLSIGRRGYRRNYL